MAASGKVERDQRGEPRAGVQSVERALGVLQLFNHGAADLGITEIAKLTGLNLSTAHRLVRALCHEHFMEQDPSTERYRLGAALLVLGQRALDHSGYGVALPLLEQLTATTGESATLGIRRGEQVLVVLTASSSQRLRFDHPAGAGIGLHASAMGKVLLAFSTDGIDSAVAGLGDLERYTASTITSQSALMAELHRVREVGYAVNRAERYEGVSGVAAPVLGRDGDARAAVGLQGPAVRMPTDSIESFGPTVRHTADAIGALLEP